MVMPDTPTILIVDDDQGLLRLIQRTLKREGFVTATASSGQEAIAWIKQHQADLLLLDLKLEDIEGRELINHLSGIGRSVPFIIITGQGDERVAVDMMKRGALDYLVKDVNFTEFVPVVVRRALEQLVNAKKLAEADEGRRKMEQQILEISEREQRKFGHDLHDGLGQRLTGLEMLSHALVEELKGFPAVLVKQAQRLNQELRETVTQARLISHSLAPVPLGGDGLMLVLAELAASTNRIRGVKCGFVCERPISIQDQTVATHLYRIAQEAVNNALKHGQPKVIEIVLSEGGAGIELTIENDGLPMPPTEQTTRGLGLNVMRYRAGMIGARLSIEPAKRKGVRVACLLSGVKR
jgi:signal transduction histidine kinase